MIRCRFHLLRLKLETYEAKGMALTSRKSLLPACNLLNWKGILFNGMELAYLTPAAIAIRLLARRGQSRTYRQPAVIREEVTMGSLKAICRAH